VLTWLTRIAAGVLVVVAVAFVVNGLVLKQWQFWASAVGFSLVAGGWILLGNHWREVSGGSSVVLDPKTAGIASAMVIVFVLAALSMSTLG